MHEPHILGGHRGRVSLSLAAAHNPDFFAKQGSARTKHALLISLLEFPSYGAPSRPPLPTCLGCPLLLPLTRDLGAGSPALGLGVRVDLGAVREMGELGRAQQAAAGPSLRVWLASGRRALPGGVSSVG